MKLAIVILNWNGRKWLKKFLPNIVENAQGHSIYVIDNQSEDNSLLFLEENYPAIKIITNKENYGYAKGYNKGLEDVEESIYCLLNSDVEVTNNWIDPILTLFKSNKEIAVIQPKILDYNKPQYFEYAGAAGGFIDNLGFPYCQGRMFFDLEKDTNQYNQNMQIFWATGACFFIRKEDFWKVNGFDEDFFAHMEEIDLCWRLNNIDKQVYYCAQSTVYHVGGGTLEKNSPQKTYLNFRNSLFTLVKNLPINKVPIVVLQRLKIDGFVAIYFLFKNGFAHFLAVIRAHISFYRLFFKILNKRKPGKKNYYTKKYILGTYLKQKCRQLIKN